jgi:hypothetical protein
VIKPASVIPCHLKKESHANRTSKQYVDLLMNGLIDAFRGSITERVLREAPCPVLAIPQPHAE